MSKSNYEILISTNSPTVDLINLLERSFSQRQFNEIKGIILEREKNMKIEMENLEEKLNMSQTECMILNDKVMRLIVEERASSYRAKMAEDGYGMISEENFRITEVKNKKILELNDKIIESEKLYEEKVQSYDQMVNELRRKEVEFDRVAKELELIENLVKDLDLIKEEVVLLERRQSSTETEKLLEEKFQMSQAECMILRENVTRLIEVQKMSDDRTKRAEEHYHMISEENSRITKEKDKEILELNHRINQLKRNKKLESEKLYEEKLKSYDQMVDELRRKEVEADLVVKELEQKNLEAGRALEELRLKKLESDKEVELYKRRLKSLEAKLAEGGKVRFGDCTSDKDNLGDGGGAVAAETVFMSPRNSEAGSGSIGLSKKDGMILDQPCGMKKDVAQSASYNTPQLESTDIRLKGVQSSVTKSEELQGVSDVMDRSQSSGKHSAVGSSALANIANRYDAPFPIYNELEGARYEALLTRTISACRYIPSDLIDQLALREPFDKAIATLEWSKFIKLTNGTFRELTLEFYTTLRIKDKDRRILECRLMGRECEISPEVIEEAFGLPNHGIYHTPDGYDHHDFWYKISGKHEFIVKGQGNGYIRDHCYLILQKFICHAIFGKTENGRISRNELLFLYGIHTNSSVNSWAFMFDVIVRTLNHTKSVIPLGHIITGLAIHFGLFNPSSAHRFEIVRGLPLDAQVLIRAEIIVNTHTLRDPMTRECMLCLPRDKTVMRPRQRRRINDYAPSAPSNGDRDEGPLHEAGPSSFEDAGSMDNYNKN